MFTYTLIIAGICLLNAGAVKGGLPGSAGNALRFRGGGVPGGSVSTTPPPTTVDTMNSIEKTWTEYEATGHSLAKLNTISILARAITAGSFVGIGGILTASVGFDMNGQSPWAPGNGFPRFMSGAIGFPLSILLVAVTGHGAWTGDIALVTRALVKDINQTTILDYVRYFVLMWVGCFVGTALLAGLATVGQLPACQPSLAIALHKLDYGFIPTFARAIGGGFLINLAVFMARANRDMAGKALAVWFPISTYVICDFEHVLASMYFLLTGKWNGAEYSYKEIFKFLVPSTLGNVLGGLLVGCGLGSIPKENR